MSYIVIRGTGTHLDGVVFEVPDDHPSPIRVESGGVQKSIYPTAGVEVVDIPAGRVTAIVWEPQGITHRDLFARVEATYGTAPRPGRVPDIVIPNNPQPRWPAPGDTLLGRPIVEAPPGTFPPGMSGDWVLGGPEDIGKTKL